MSAATNRYVNIAAVLERCRRFLSIEQVYLREIRERWGRELKTYRSRSDIAQLHVLTTQSQPTVNDSTWHDLDMDALYDRLDSNTTPIGRQYLYRQLRTYEANESALTIQYNVALHFKEDHTHREQVQLNMWLLRSSNASMITSMLFSKLPDGDFPRTLTWCLAAISITSIVVAFIWPILFWLPIIAILMNFVFSETHAHKIGRHSLSFVYLRSLLTVASRLANIESKNIKQLEYLKNSRTQIENLQSAFSIVGLDSTSHNPVTAQFAFFLNLFCLFDFLIFMRCSQRLEEHKEKLSETYTAVASIDSAISVASYLTYNSNLCNPTFGEAGKIDFKRMTHPLLQGSVPNDYTSDKHSALITGSNMAGKSTFIKAIGTNLILAQTLWFCHAESAHVQKAPVMSSIKRTDSLKEGKSYYFAEIEALLQLIEASDNERSHVFLIDEILHGTNTVERISAAAAVLEYISRSNTVIVTSHDIELSQLLPSRYRSFHFRETADPDNMFDFKLREGHSSTRNAITLLESIGFPADVISNARKFASNLDDS